MHVCVYVSTSCFSGIILLLHVRRLESVKQTCGKVSSGTNFICIGKRAFELHNVTHTHPRTRTPTSTYICVNLRSKNHSFAFAFVFRNSITQMYFGLSHATRVNSNNNNKNKRLAHIFGEFIYSLPPFRLPFAVIRFSFVLPLSAGQLIR